MLEFLECIFGQHLSGVGDTFFVHNFDEVKIMPAPLIAVAIGGTVYTFTAAEVALATGTVVTAAYASTPQGQEEIRQAFEALDYHAWQAGQVARRFGQATADKWDDFVLAVASSQTATDAAGIGAEVYAEGVRRLGGGRRPDPKTPSPIPHVAAAAPLVISIFVLHNWDDLTDAAPAELSDIDPAEMAKFSKLQREYMARQAEIQRLWAQYQANRRAGVHDFAALHEIQRLESLPFASLAVSPNTLQASQFMTAGTAGWGLSREDADALLDGSIDAIPPVNIGGELFVIARRGVEGGPIVVVALDGEFRVHRDGQILSAPYGVAVRPGDRLTLNGQDLPLDIDWAKWEEARQVLVDSGQMRIEEALVDPNLLDSPDVVEEAPLGGFRMPEPAPAPEGHIMVHGMYAREIFFALDADGYVADLEDHYDLHSLIAQLPDSELAALKVRAHGRAVEISVEQGKLRVSVLAGPVLIKQGESPIVEFSTGTTFEMPYDVNSLNDPLEITDTDGNEVGTI